ncbi:MAG: DUF4383 domain-containing protein [Bdellovibrionales bacterium]|nr:DUF4383 domain-containing protein [Bdellovibrionales bacterium]
MQPRKFALVSGIVMLLMGVLSLIPTLSTDPFTSELPLLDVNTSYGLFLGLFPMNIFNKVALIVFGLIGISAASGEQTSLPRSILYAKAVFFVMGALAILGMIPATNTLGGRWPLFAGTMWEHLVFALVGGYFGFTLPRKASTNVEVKNAVEPQFEKPIKKSA